MPGANNLGNGNQIRDGLEPCPRDELVEAVARAMKPELFGEKPDNLVGPVTLYERNYARGMAERAIAVVRHTRSEANQSSLDTMGGRIEALADVLSDLFENPDYTVAIGGNPIMVDKLMERARKALRGAA